MSSDSSPSAGGGTYAWYARTTPMYLALLPVAIGIGIWFPTMSISKLLGAVVISPAVFAVLLGEKGRDRGRRLQPQLWESWGGPLLTQYLRHQNTDIDSFLRLEYHRKLQALLPNLTIPNAEEEAANPEAAEKIYSSCAQHLVNVLREDPKRFWSAFKENRSQGFRRNLWGLKPLGIICSLASVMASGVWLYSHWNGPETVTANWLVATLTCGGLLIVWTFFITQSWVRAAYDAYARRALESLPKMDDRDRLG